MFSPPVLRPCQTARQLYRAVQCNIAINEFQNKTTEVGLTFTLFSPEAKVDSNQRDNFMEQVESMKNMAYVRATLISEGGKTLFDRKN